MSPYFSAQDVEDWESGTYPAPIIERDSITLADFSLSYKIYESDKLGAFTIRTEIDNILDEDYAFVNGYPMPGRSFFMSLKWDFI